MATETALITGASSGIGRELAELFAADGADVVLVARSEGKLARLARTLRERYGASARVLRKDLSAPGAGTELFEDLNDAGVRVDVVVNNAGFGARGSVASLEVERQLDMIRVNIEALTALTRLFLPGMLERGRGGVLNVASTAGFQPGPYLAVYYATKAYVLSFTEALAEEVAGSGVTVTCLAPGPTHTGFAAEADMQETRLFRLGAMGAETVARAGYRGLRAGKVLVVPGPHNRLGAVLVRFAPRALVRKVTKYLQS